MTLIERLIAALALAAPGDLLPGDLHDSVASLEPLREAAVLVAITDRPDPGVLLTERRHDLRVHGGQIAFPGGRIDDGENAEQAALREAWEEIGLDPAKVHVVGQADHYRTVTGYGVTPVVGIVPPDIELKANPHEVADWFEAPLAFLLDPANQQRRTAHFRGRERSYFEIDWNGRQVWGATAAMIVNLTKRLQWN
ncbi:MAG: CoA pyrophosphatase [Sphingomicrobium sp.]